MYRIEQWSERGITFKEAPTKREANNIASRMRGDNTVLQTVVIFPNGKLRICRKIRK